MASILDAFADRMCLECFNDGSVIYKEAKILPGEFVKLTCPKCGRKRIISPEEVKIEVYLYNSK